MKGHHQPCMAVYTKLTTEPINVKNAPKFTEVDENAFEYELKLDNSQKHDYR